MRLIVLLGLCAFLTACVVPATTLENRAPTESSLEPKTEPTVSFSVESNIPLYIWNDTRRRYEIHLIDPATGEDIPGYVPFVVSENTDFTGSNILSLSGQQLAIVAANGEYCYPMAGGTACMGRADTLHIINRRIWHQVKVPLPSKGWAGPMSFSPNEKNLVLILNEPKTSTIMLFDTKTGSLLAQHEIAFQPSMLGYTNSGIVVFGQPLGSNPGISKPSSPRVLLLDTKSLEIKWEQKLPNIVSGYWCLEKCDASHAEQTFANWTPAVVLTPNRDRLYIVHADEQQLTTVDFDTRTVLTIGIQETKSWFDMLLALDAGVARAKGSSTGVFKAGVLSPDGTRLYVVGQIIISTLTTEGQLQETKQSLGVEVINVDSGQILSRADVDATWLKTTPDGKHLLLGSWAQEGIKVLDAASLEHVADLTQWELVATIGMNGQTMILASRSGQSLTRLAVLDPITFDPSLSWSLKTSYASWVSTP